MVEGPTLAPAVHLAGVLALLQAQVPFYRGHKDACHVGIIRSTANRVGDQATVLSHSIPGDEAACRTGQAAGSA